MKKLGLAIYATIIGAFPALAGPSNSPKRDIAILRDEIERQELVLAILKEKLEELENEVATDRFRIEIGQDKLLLDEETVSGRELEERIESMPPDASVSILADSATPHREVMVILDLLKTQGITDLVLSSSKREAGVEDKSEPLRSSP